jgi:hypothetical protein
MSEAMAEMQLPAALPLRCRCKLMFHQGDTGRRLLSSMLQLLEASWTLVLKLMSRLAMRRVHRPLSVRRQMRWTMLAEPCSPVPVCLSVIHSDRMTLRPAAMRADS